MQDMEETLNPGQRLEIIEDMLEAGRRRFVEDGKIYVLWGSVAVLASAIHWFSASVFKEYWVGPLIWGLSFTLGFLFVWRLVAKSPPRVRSYITKAINGIWIATCISLALLMVLTFTGLIPLESYFPIICIVLGLAYWAVSPLVRFSAMRALAVVWWIGGLASALAPGLWAIVILNILVVVCEIIPGAMMIRHAKKVGPDANR